MKALKGKLMTFRELPVYLAFRLVFTVHDVFIIFAALHDGQSQGFKSNLLRDRASVVILELLEFVVENRTRVYFAQHVANIVFCCETSCSQTC